MKKLILLTLTAITLIACADNGVSAPSQICYDKKLTYQDVTSPEYRDYETEWLEKLAYLKNMVLNVFIGILIMFSRFVNVWKMLKLTN